MLGVVFELGVGKAAAGHGEQEPVDEAEVVADLWLARARRQERSSVLDLAAHLVPDLGQAIGPVLGLDVDLDDRQPGAGDRIELVELRQLLQGPLQPIGDLLLDLLGAGAGVGGNDGGRLHRELRILEPA